MSPSPPPPNNPPPKTLLGQVSQLFQHTRANFSQLVLKPQTRVPKLLVWNEDSDTPKEYPLLGDRYLLGRSSKASDIVVPNPLVSQVHLSLSRDSRQRRPTFTIQDEKSTNGIYRGKRRLPKLELYHGDVLTLGPPELANGVRVEFWDPPPWYVRGFRWGIYGTSGVMLLAGLFVAIEWTKFQVRPLPYSQNGPVVVYSRDGETPLREPYNTSHVEWKRLTEFGGYLPKAVVASEDSRFNWHFGVDPIGILRALAVNFRGGDIRQGASTISQQVARSLYRDYVGTEDSLGRKVREAIVALKLETFYSKDEILLAYLNRVYLGIDLYGFEDAAQFYFGRSARELSLSEAATLVGMLPAPNNFNPVTNYDLAIESRNLVLGRMQQMGMVSAEEANRARRSVLQVNPKAKEILEGTIAPYFYNYVFVELEELLGDVANEGNFIIETGLDPRLQTEAETALESGIDRGTGYEQGAIVTLNSSNGEIIAMTGGEDYSDSQFNRATQALRQPGSTFKIFAYTAALEQGISPGQTYTCAPITWRGQAFRGCERTSGSADLYRGLVQSENSIALRVAQDVGLGSVVRTARKMGIASDLNPVPGLVLGQSEVTLLEMTGAFAVLANQGVYEKPHAIRRIWDSSDCENYNDWRTCRLIYDYEQMYNPQQVVEPGVARTMTQMLQGVVSGGTGTSASLGVGEAGKTGTTNDGVDLWFIGYVPQQSIVSGVWLGNDDNSPTYGSSAQAASVWQDYMEEVIR